MPIDIAFAEASDFEPYLQQEFRIALNESEFVRLRLDEVKTYAAAASINRKAPFSLFFYDIEHPNAYLNQNLYRLENDTLGTLELFLVPRGPHASKGMQYEIMFN